GILPFYQISKVSLETLGLLMSTYIGSRTEVRIRLHPLLVRYLDFLSMYPTVCILQDLWSFVIAEEVCEQDCTEWTRQFMSKIALDDLNNPRIWKELSVIVCVRPDRDILPIRAKYSNKHAYNIGLNHVTSKRLLWFCLADVIASKMLTGKTPEIVKAIRFVPKGMQKLKEISILGEKINPYADVFKKIVEKKEKMKDTDDPRD